MIEDGFSAMKSAPSVSKVPCGSTYRTAPPQKTAVTARAVRETFHVGLRRTRTVRSFGSLPKLLEIGLSRLFVRDIAVPTSA